MSATAANQPSTRQRIRQDLQQRILSGELEPGRRLTQTDLASRYSVAQTVIRESLMELRYCGLVESVDNVGVFVADLSPDHLLEAYDLREIFEGLAARLCCEQASRRDVNELSELSDRIHEAGTDGRLDDAGHLDRKLHLQTFRICGNRLLDRLTEGYRFLGMVVRAERNIDEVHQEHHQIIRAIADGEPERAETLAREHVRRARSAVKRMMDEQRFRPHWVVDPDSQK